MNDMTSKIALYREVLEDDPTSRVFFPLAKMLSESGRPEEAVAVLTKSVSAHPGHLEARFLLVELLTRLGRGQESAAIFDEVLPLLTRYPSVWSLWAAKAKLSRDSSVAMRLVAQNLAGGDVSFLDVLEKGLAAIGKTAGETASPGLVVETPREQGEDFSLRGAAEVQALARRLREDGEPRAEEKPFAVKTRTMADLLAKHGDYAEAVSIYKQLAEQASDQAEREELYRRAGELQALAEPAVAAAREESAPKKGSKSDLVSMLEALADRLDARSIS